MRVIDVLLPGTVIVFLATVIVSNVRRANARRKALVDFAARLGMTYRDSPQGPEVEGTVRGVPLRIGRVTKPALSRRGQRSSIRFTGRPQRPLPTIIVRDRNAPNGEMLPGLAELRLGDAAFDDAFSLYTADEAAAGALLDPALVAQLVGGGQQSDRAEAMKIDAREVFIDYDGLSGTHHEPERLERIVDVVTTLCAPVTLR